MYLNEKSSITKEIAKQINEDNTSGNCNFDVEQRHEELHLQKVNDILAYECEYLKEYEYDYACACQ